MSLNESIVEDAALGWFGELGYEGGHGPPLAPGEPAAERDSFSEVVLVGRLREAIRRLNTVIPRSRTLATLRDTLLSGELSLPAAMLATQAGVGDGSYSKSSNNSKPTETNP